MNYYEELGVRQDAPVEDIRQAYKMLARLLHPDGQVDPKLKELAERQMKRLGEMVEILGDPAKRCHYDDVLLLGSRPQIVRRDRVIPVPTPGWWDNSDGWAGFAVRYWFWILIGIFVVALGTWTFMQGDSTVLDRGVPGVAQRLTTPVVHRDPQPVQRAEMPKRVITPEIATSSPVIPAPRVPIAKSVRTPNVVPPTLPYGPAVEEAPLSGLAAPELPADTAKSAPQSTPPVRKESSFAGTWLYSPQADDVAERGKYPAIYVELLLVEHDGELSGDYRARYKILDQAVSHEVTFQIRGAAGSVTSAKLAWISTDNAKGLAEMTLRSPNVLHVSWWTTEFGPRPTLGSGTATLIRQQAP